MVDILVASHEAQVKGVLFETDPADVTTPDVGEVVLKHTASGFVSVDDQDSETPIVGTHGVPTGARLSYWGTTAPDGWVLEVGRTIGNADSGATERANDDCEDLFKLLWDGLFNLFLQDSSGVGTTAGASAQADWDADKRLIMPDTRGRVSASLDDLGAGSAGVIGHVSGTRMGGALGVQNFALNVGHLPIHDHAGVVKENAGALNNATSTASGGSSTDGTGDNAGDGLTAETGSGNAHQNMQPTVFAGHICKL